MYAMEDADSEALRAAATTGSADALRFLFARSDSHPPVVLRQTISSAAWHGHPAALEVILAQAMGEELKQTLVQEAMGMASQAGVEKVLPLMLSAGANANATTSNGRREHPWHWQNITTKSTSCESCRKEFEAGSVDRDVRACQTLLRRLR